ncbi:15276_t:CDS:2 [Funneliformis geosporum]|nr:15276_t:CDS:2 [Funneliformis geosporum]
MKIDAIRITETFLASGISSFRQAKRVPTSVWPLRPALDVCIQDVLCIPTGVWPLRPALDVWC